GHNLQTRSFFDELKGFDGDDLFDLGHPLLNRIGESFIKAAGVGAVQALSRQTVLKIHDVSGQNSSDNPHETGGSKRYRCFLGLGENNSKSVEALVKSSGKESLKWGLAAGIYSGVSYGLKEATGVHDWKNSAFAGAVTGAALALTSDDHSGEEVMQCAISGAAISTAAHLLSGIL
ncbi:hypothetical protein M569_16286, partial [Genlisea aurea]